MTDDGAPVARRAFVVYDHVHEPARPDSGPPLSLGPRDRFRAPGMAETVTGGGYVTLQE